MLDSMTLDSMSFLGLNKLITKNRLASGDGIGLIVFKYALPVIDYSA